MPSSCEPDHQRESHETQDDEDIRPLHRQELSDWLRDLLSRSHRIAGHHRPVCPVGRIRQARRPRRLGGDPEHIHLLRQRPQHRQIHVMM